VNLQLAIEVFGLRKPLVAQSMYICKQPFIGGVVTPHQDGTFIFTTPESVSAMWFPIDDATVANACIWAVPGSHKDPIRTRMKLNAARDGIYFEPPLSQLKWPDDSQYVPCEVKKGSVLCMHGRVAHKSPENVSDKPRHAYTFHLVDGNAKWVDDNWLTRPPFLPLQAV